MKSITLLYLMIVVAWYQNLSFAQSSPPLSTYSMIRNFSSATGNFDQSALMVKITPSNISSELLNAKMKCFSFYTQWAGREDAWDFNLTAAYEFDIISASWVELREVLKHLPSFQERYCTLPLHTTPPDVDDIAESLHEVTGIRWLPTSSVNNYSQYARRLVVNSNMIFQTTNIGSMVTHIGGTMLVRPSQRENERHLKVCTWDHSVFNASFPEAIDPTRYENKRLCQIINQSIYNSTPYLSYAEQAVIPANPY